MQVAAARNLLPRPTFCVGEAWGKQLTAFHGVDLPPSPVEVVIRQFCKLEF